MLLKKFSYKEFETNDDKKWILDQFDLNNINLFVGDNASGKSRTLKYIHQLSRILLSNRFSLISGYYDIELLDSFEKNLYKFKISFKDGAIESEELCVNERLLLNRSIDGKGEIYNDVIDTKIEFKLPPNELISTRRDELQYPFLEKLFNWASNVRHFRFSKEEEKNRLFLIDSNRTVTSGFNNNNIANQAIEVFRQGRAKFKDEFVEKIIDDFNSIGYNITDINVGALHSIIIDSPIANKVVGLRVKESDRNAYTDQSEMSDGMFRALSLIIHYNFYQLTNNSLSVLVDDIGEGLDYNRSTKLIKLLIQKSLQSNIQIIMSSNDKFVLNNTDLKYWQIVDRKANIVNIYNYSNCKEKFENFKFLGLNNFDFYVSDFFNEDFKQ
jgi:ABC-type lipoprotein export system ATPase subunit